MASAAKRLIPLIPDGARIARVDEIERLADKLLSARRVVILSGAGLSTESGLRDYRSPGRELRRVPMSASVFAGSVKGRAKYWARSYAGYEYYTRARPNAAHKSLSALQQQFGHKFRTHITQNVDGLLLKAGTPPASLIELHGTLSHVQCMNCGWTMPRQEFQGELRELNLSMKIDKVLPKPDGDAEIPASSIDEFNLVDCPQCGSDAIKPGVVFNGGSVPKQVTESARAAVDAADMLWVLGTSLSPYSAFSLVKRAHQNGALVHAVSYGKTRGDALFNTKYDTVVGNTVERVVSRILSVR